MTEARTWTFLAHTLDQVGPPVFLLHLLRWLAIERPAIRPEVIALTGGRLRPAFDALGTVTVVGDPGQPTERRDASSWATVAPVPLANGAPPRTLVYVNTAASIRALPALGGAARPHVAHVHELEVGLSYHLDADERAAFLAAPHLVAASQAVADNLIAHHGIDRHTVAVHHELLSIDDDPPSASAAAVRAGLGIDPAAYVVGTAAVVNWRKGADLFLQLAVRLRAARPDLDVHFVWLGGVEDDPDTLRFEADRDAAGVAGHVHLTPFVDRPLDWMRSFDVFALTAREDAYPLACLEAASAGIPIVCFASGGMPEFVEDDAGIVVPFADVDAMVKALADLADDPHRRARLGHRAATNAPARHAVGRVAPALLADLERWEASS